MKFLNVLCVVLCSHQNIIGQNYSDASFLFGESTLKGMFIENITPPNFSLTVDTILFKIVVVDSSGILKSKKNVNLDFTTDRRIESSHIKTNLQNDFRKEINDVLNFSEGLWVASVDNNI